MALTLGGLYLLWREGGKIVKREEETVLKSKFNKLKYGPPLKGIKELSDAHKGEDIFVVGTGPSLMGFDFSSLNDFTTIALNDAVKAPGFEPSYHLFSDTCIWHRYKKPFEYPQKTKIIAQDQPCINLRKSHQGAKKHSDFIGFRIRGLRLIRKEGTGPDCLFTGRTVANAGMLLARNMGAERVFLMGVDGYCLEGPDKHNKEKGKVHYYDGRPHEKGDQQSRPAMGVGRDDGHERMVVRRLSNMAYHLELIYTACMLPLYPSEPGWPGRGVYNLSEHSVFDFVGTKVPVEEAIENARCKLLGEEPPGGELDASLSGADA